MKRLGDDGPIPESIDGVKIPKELRDSKANREYKDKMFEDFGVPEEMREDVEARVSDATQLAFLTLNKLATLYEIVDDDPIKNREAAEEYITVMNSAIANEDLVVTMLSICIASQVNAGNNKDNDKKGS